jgi:hypothetical protein
MFKSYGKIKYDPISPRTKFKKWWMILQCDKELIRYYQHIYYKTHWKKLQTAAWGPHISASRGTEPINKDSWNKHSGKTIEFSYEYNGLFQSNGSHVWLPVKSDKLCDIREELGLTREPKIPFHLSIGFIPK